MNTTTGMCYVCFEDGAPPSACGCRDRYLHVACMLKQVETSGKTKCGVCTQEYANIEMRSTSSLSRRGKVVISLLVLWPFCFALTCWRAEDWLSDPNQGTRNVHAGRAVETVLELLVTIMSSLYLSMEFCMYRKGAWRLLVHRACPVVSVV